jgi:hypothetical protein
MRYYLSCRRKGANLATKTEITDAIRAGINRVEATFTRLDDEQLNTQIHNEPGGWTAHDILAHLAGRKKTYELLINLASNSNGTSPGNLDLDSWNHQIVEERKTLSRHELLSEFRATHEELIDRSNALRDDQLALLLILPNRESSLGDVLLGSGGMHSIQHTQEVEEVLGIDHE